MKTYLDSHISSYEKCQLCRHSLICKIISYQGKGVPMKYVIPFYESSGKTPVQTVIIKMYERDVLWPKRCSNEICNTIL